MEFDDLQKIWTNQSETHLYTLNETAMQNYIASKVKNTLRRTDISELVLITIYLGAGIFNLLVAGRFLYLWLTGSWIIITALVVLVSRIRRFAGKKRFDKSMLGDLHHAASVATYQIKLSLAMRWNAVPIFTFVFLTLWSSHKPIWAFGLIAFLFACSFFVSRREFSYLKTKKRELEMLIHDLSLQ